MRSPHAPTVAVDLSPSRGVPELLGREGPFLAVMAALFLVTGLTFQTPAVAMWLGFAFAAYGATSNDSIQTLGTFLASNAQRPWWVLWAWIGGIFLATVTTSWVLYDGDVSWGRLASKGFETAPSSFSYLQVAAPLFLLLLTRFKVPVSTTFLCLSGFAASASSIGAILSKSLGGYVAAFTVAIAVWMVVERVASRLFVGAPHWGWMPLQWVTTGALWSIWLMQDAANVAVFLPRQLSGLEFTAFAGVMLAGLAVLFLLRGDRIQSVVNEKSDVVDVRSATVIDLVYTGVLAWFTVVSPIPMSTTWVFVGLLAGRELAIAVSRRLDATRSRWDGVQHAAALGLKDLVAVTIGLAISLTIAASVNPVIRAEFASALSTGLAFLR